MSNTQERMQRESQIAEMVNEVFTDPVSYLRRFGLEVELISETVFELPEAA